MHPEKLMLTPDHQSTAPTTRTARPSARLGRLATTHRSAGAAVIVSCLLVAVVIATQLALRPAPAVATPNYSAHPAGFTEYQGVFTIQLRPNYSALPQGLTDHQAPRAAATVPSDYSALPGGLTDYQELFTTQLRPTYSQVPPGLTDYQRLQQPAPHRSSLSAPPAFMHDHPPASERATTHSSAPPRYAQDHLDGWK